MAAQAATLACLSQQEEEVVLVALEMVAQAPLARMAISPRLAWVLKWAKAAVAVLVVQSRAVLAVLVAHRVAVEVAVAEVVLQAEHPVLVVMAAV